MNQHFPMPRPERIWPNWWGLVGYRAHGPSVVALSFNDLDMTIYSYVVVPH